MFILMIAVNFFFACWVIVQDFFLSYAKFLQINFFEEIFQENHQGFK